MLLPPSDLDVLDYDTRHRPLVVWRIIMTDKKIIAVIGATGAQGGRLVRAISGDKDQRVQRPASG